MLDKRPSLIAPFAAAAVLAAVIFAADLNLPLGIAGGVPYVAVVLLGWWLPKRRYIFVMAAMCTALTVVGYAYSPPGGVPWVVTVNRFLALFAIWIVAALLFMAKTELRAREKSQESEQRFRDMTEAASDWIWEMGPDLRFTYFSDSFLPVSGVEPEATLGKTRREVAAAQEDPAKWEAHLEDLDRHRPFRDFIYEIVLADGTTRHIKISGKPIFTERGHFMGYRGTGSNVTAQVEAEKRARDAEHHLADAIESLSDGVALYDADERFVMCNSKYLETHREIEDTLIPGTHFEEILRLAVEHGIVKGLNKKDFEEYLPKRLARFRDPGPPEIRQLRSGRWVSVQDYKTRDGGTFIIQTDITERKRAEDALHESEERLSTIFEASPIGIAIVSTETNKRLYVNPAMVELFGAASAEQLLAHDLATTYVDPADLKRLRAGEGDDFIAEMEIERKRLDGTTWWCLLNRRMIDYEGQKALMALHYDISGRKNTEEALRESELRFRDLAETASDWFWETDSENRFISQSDQFYEVTGRTPEDIIGKTRLELADKAALETHAEAWRLHLEDLEARRPFSNFVRSIPGRPGTPYEGKRIFVRLNGRPRFDEKGDFLGYRGTATDITREIETEEALRESELRFRDLAETASDWFWEMDPDFRFTYVSEKFFEVTKFKHEDIIGQTRQETADPMSQEEDPDAWARHQEDLEARRPFSNFVRSFSGRSGTPYEGKRIYVRLNGRPRFDEKGEFLGYRGTATDITREIETEKALRENELRLKAIIDTVPAIVNVKDTDGRYILSNRFHGEFFGLDRKKIIGKRSTVLSRKHSRKTREMERAIVESGEALPAYELKAKDTEGRERNLLVTKVPLRDLSNEIVGIVTTSMDITERTQAEEELRENGERLRLILENAVTGIITIDEKGMIQSFNPAARTLFGYREKDVIGKNVSMLMPEPDHSKHDGYLGKFLKTGKAGIIGIGREVEGLRKNGSVFPMELGVSELVQGGKRTFTGFIEDISERKQAEAALRESEERFRDLAESAADWFWEMDQDLRFTYMSDRYYQVTGRKPKDIIGKTRLETADAKTLEAEGDAWRLHQEVLERRKPFGNFVQSSLGLPGGRYEGRRYYLRLNGRPRFDEDGEFLGYRGTATDITREIEAENELLEARDKLEERVTERTRELSEEVEERKRMEVDLRRAKEAAELSDRAKSEFLANMSHELRTPLNSIIGFSDMLHSQVLGSLGNPKYLEYLTDINASGRHLLDLIRDILDVSKIEAGALDLVDEPVNLRMVVDSSIIMVSERALRAGVAVYTDIPDDLPWLKGDKLRIKQILLNLLGNAVKFTPADGEVTVSAGLWNGGGVFLAVEDTGVGISKKDLERVTEPFAQGAGSMTRGYEGTGLGLALVKSLVELHGGSLLIESRTGEGTQVTVQFPKERTLTAH